MTEVRREIEIWGQVGLTNQNPSPPQSKLRGGATALNTVQSVPTTVHTSKESSHWRVPSLEIPPPAEEAIYVSAVVRIFV